MVDGDLLERGKPVQPDDEIVVSPLELLGIGIPRGEVESLQAPAVRGEALDYLCG